VQSSKHQIARLARAPCSEQKIAQFRTHDFYPSQTKILEGRTNILERIFEALLKGVSTGFGRQNVEKCFENAF
jgi:hypothetical protein